MADFRINVIIDPSRAKRGGRQVERALDRVGQSADRTRRLIARAVSFVAVTAGVRQLIFLTDTFVNMQNRLRIVTKDTAELTVVTQELFKAANATRSSFAGTAELFTRVALATRELGVSQKQLLQFTKSVNQAIILSGASAREANAGLIQLSQGLASGTLRGDELRSVLEQLPKVADVIAKGMGVLRGELRLIGAQGKITADVVLDAFVKARDELEELFKSTVPTISQSFQVLKNNVIELVGAFNESSGAGGVLSRAIMATANSIETIARVAAAAGIALGVNFAVRGVGAAITAVRALTLAILANPFVALATALTIVVSLLITFADKIDVGADRLANLEDLATATFEAIGRVVDKFVQFFEDNFGFVADFARDVFREVEFSIEGVLRVTARVVDAVVGFFKGAFDAIIIVFEDLPSEMERIFAESFNVVLGTLTDFVNQIIEVRNFIREEFGAEPIDLLEPFQLEQTEVKARNIGSRMVQAIADGIEGQTAAEDALDSILDRAEQIAQERIARQKAAQALADAALAALGARRPVADKGFDKAFQDILDDLRDENRLLQLNTKERFLLATQLDAEEKLKRDLTEIERARLSIAAELNFALQVEREVLDDILGPLEEYEIRLRAINTLLKANKLTTGEAAAAIRDLRIELLETETSLEAGFERGLLKISKDIEDFASLSERLVTDAFRGAEDALVKFVTTGKLSFKDLADSIIEDLARIAIRQAIVVSALSGGFGFGFTEGGVVEAAHGGLVRGKGTGTSDSIPARLSDGEFVTNATSTDRFLPLLRAINGFPAGGGVGPATGEKGGDTNVSVVIVDQRGRDAPPVEQRQRTNADGSRQITVFIRDTVRRQITGGEHDIQFQQRFGLRPSLTR